MFGLIPNYWTCSSKCCIDALDQEAQKTAEPKNAITKQYKRLEIDGVELEFDEGAIEEIAKVSKKIGVRLRFIMESSMMDTV